MCRKLICLVSFVLVLALTTQGYAELIYTLPGFTVAPPPMEGSNNKMQINFNLSRLPEFANLVDPASGMIGGGNIAGDLYYALRAYPLTTIAGQASNAFAWISPVTGDIDPTAFEDGLYGVGNTWGNTNDFTCFINGKTDFVPTIILKLKCVTSMSLLSSLQYLPVHVSVSASCLSRT